MPTTLQLQTDTVAVVQMVQDPVVHNLSWACSVQFPKRNKTWTHQPSGNAVVRLFDPQARNGQISLPTFAAALALHITTLTVPLVSCLRDVVVVVGVNVIGPRVRIIPIYGKTRCISSALFF